MIKKGTDKFRKTFFTVLKAGLLSTGKNLTSPSNVRCCEICNNESLLCHATCKYRSATYKEYLDERFDVKCKNY